MRVLLGAVLLCSPVALAPLATTSALADSAIGELQSTETKPASAIPTVSSPAPENRTTTDDTARSVRRHKVAGSHYERERLRQSQTNG